MDFINPYYDFLKDAKLIEIDEAIDYEQFVHETKDALSNHVLKDFIQLPNDDIQIIDIKKQFETIELPKPELEFGTMRHDIFYFFKLQRAEIDLHVNECLRSYHSNYLYMARNYEKYTTSNIALKKRKDIKRILSTCEKQEYEMDLLKEQTNQFPSHLYNKNYGIDLESVESDKLMQNLLDKVQVDSLMRQNETKRSKFSTRHLFNFYYPYQDDNDLLEYRQHFDVPLAHQTSSLLARCTKLKLDFDIEPIFAHMCLYDLKERKKISENFYFDLNTDKQRQMIKAHTQFNVDLSTLCNTCVLNLTYVSNDIYLVVRIDKVLQQGDIGECIEPYLKYQQMQQQNERSYFKEKHVQIAQQFCERLGKYRMPFAWTAINLTNILNINSDALKKTTSLDRNLKSTSSISSANSASSAANDDIRLNRQQVQQTIQNFKPISICINTFFKQDIDKLTDEDLFRFLNDLKKTTTQLKKLKCINGVLKIEFAPFKKQMPAHVMLNMNNSHNRFQLINASLNKLVYKNETYDKTVSAQSQGCTIIKDVLEFPSKEVYEPNYDYLNLMYLYPLQVNFSNRTTARNIAIKIKFMKGESDHCSLPYIYGRSSTRELCKELYLNVMYHNKTPQFYDEVKIKLPAFVNSTLNYHLLFTFYHISCNNENTGKKQMADDCVETLVGYSWLPLTQFNSDQLNRCINSGTYTLPIIFDKLPSGYSNTNPFTYLAELFNNSNVGGSTANAQSAQNKCYFELKINIQSTVYTQDYYLDKFIHLSNSLLTTEHYNYQDMYEIQLKQALNDLHMASNEKLIKFLFIVFDKLFNLMIIFSHNTIISNLCLESISKCVNKVTSLLHSQNDKHNRNKYLIQYVKYTCNLPYKTILNTRHNSSLIVDHEYGTGTTTTTTTTSMPTERLFHEELLIHLINLNDNLRLSISENLWFYLELLYKSMCFYIFIVNNTTIINNSQMQLSKHKYFSKQFLINYELLYKIFINNIFISTSLNKKLVNAININLAFFLCDSFALLDRNFLFNIINIYMNELNFKILKKFNEHKFYYLLYMDFLRIVFSTEHFVSLNLPYVVRSTGTTNTADTFHKQHYMLGILLKNFRFLFNSNSNFTYSHVKCINLLRNLLESHDYDDRLYSTSGPNGNLTGTNREYGNHARIKHISYLYVRFLVELIDYVSDLYEFKFEANSCANRKPLLYIQIGYDTHSDSDIHKPAHKRFAKKFPPNFNDDTIRTLLVCLMWIMSNNDSTSLFDLMTEWPLEKLDKLVRMLDLASFYFEYKGKTELKLTNNDSKVQTSRSHSNKSLIKTKLENLILGTQNARSDFIKRMKTSALDSSTANTTTTASSLSTMSTYNLLNSHSNNDDNSSESIAEDDMHNNYDTADLIDNDVDFYCDYINDEDITNENDTCMPHFDDYHGHGRLTRQRSTVIGSTHTAVDPSTEAISIDDIAIFQTNLSIQNVIATLNMVDILLKTIDVNKQQYRTNYTLLITNIFKLILNALNMNQSTQSLKFLFEYKRLLLVKYPEYIFEVDQEYCTDLCSCLLQYCTSSIGAVRSEASATLYLLMRQNYDLSSINFSRIKIQITISLSALVGQNAAEIFFNELYLKKSLRTILSYTEGDLDLGDCTIFSSQIRDLLFNLNIILCDTVKMKEHLNDSEMLIDLMHRIANCYQNNPDLRLQWLQNMAQKHLKCNSLIEAGQCLIHAAALVAEYLNIYENKAYLPIGCESFRQVNANVIEESAVSDDVFLSTHRNINNDCLCMGKYFSESGLIGLIEQAAVFLMHSQHYEASNELYKILIPIYEAYRDYKKLSQVHSKLNDCFNKIMIQGNKRLFGTYFRVGFYGKLFDELDGEEFVYKEPGITKLSEIAQRLEAFYADKFGNGYVEIMKDSNNVDRKVLDSNKVYIQVTYVEPYLDRWELQSRITHFEKNYLIKRFIYSTPFTLDGKAHGSLRDQYKRKTILTTERAFPYVKTRISVIDRQQIVLSPIEVAIEDLQKKIEELRMSIVQEPADPKILQMVLQGCVGTTVNQGPLEMAQTFLQPSNSLDFEYTQNHNKLRLCFKEFTRRCDEALKKNKTLIGPDQKEYQKELEKNYAEFKMKIEPFIEYRSFKHSE